MTIGAARRIWRAITKPSRTTGRDRGRTYDVLTVAGTSPENTIIDQFEIVRIDGTPIATCSSPRVARMVQRALERWSPVDPDALPRQLWLDDWRPPPTFDWLWVRSIGEAVLCLKHFDFERCSIDHDLRYAHVPDDLVWACWPDAESSLEVLASEFDQNVLSSVDVVRLLNEAGPLPDSLEIRNARREIIGELYDQLEPVPADLTFSKA